MRHGTVGAPGASQMISSFLHWCQWKNTVIRFIIQRRNICQIFCTRWKERVPIFYQVSFGGSWWRDDVVKSVFAYSLIRMHYSQWGDVFADFSSCVAASETICIPKDTWCQGVHFGCIRWRHPCLVTSQYPVLWFKTDILTPCSLNTVEYLRLKWTTNYTYCTGLLV